MQRRRLRVLAMAVATIGLVMLGDPRPAKAEILITVTASGTTSTFDSNTLAAPNTNSNTSFATPTFSIGGADGYTGTIDSVTTNFSGGPIATLSTTVNLAPTATNPETLTIQVQLVNNTTAPSMGTNNLLWQLPNSSPVAVAAGSSLSPQTGVISGTVTTNTYFNSTTSMTTTGIGASTAMATTTLPPGNPGAMTVNVMNPSGTYTLSQVVTLSNLVVSSALVGPPAGTFNFGGTSSVSAVVPEPSTLAIAGVGAMGMIGYGLRRRRAVGA